MTRKSKFKAGDVVYYKYPSRYSSSKDKKTNEAIIYIAASPDGGSVGHDMYLIKILKSIRGNSLNIARVQIDENEYLCDQITIETYSRKLTPTEQVLYGKRV